MAWHRTPYLEGGWTAAVHQRRIPALLRRPAGWFAGDWLSHVAAWQPPFVSARATVEALHRQVMNG
jgi:monoamine oxidase